MRTHDIFSRQLDSLAALLLLGRACNIVHHTILVHRVLTDTYMCHRINAITSQARCLYHAATGASYNRAMSVFHASPLQEKSGAASARRHVIAGCY